VEAIKAHSEANKRILEQLAVIGTFPDSVSALKSYLQLRREAPDRELYVFHTSRETLDITERRWLGIRGVRIKILIWLPFLFLSLPAAGQVVIDNPSQIVRVTVEEAKTKDVLLIQSVPRNITDDSLTHTDGKGLSNLTVSSPRIVLKVLDHAK
jgi:hypothetical protein